VAAIMQVCECVRLATYLVKAHDMASCRAVHAVVHDRCCLLGVPSH
jgi:hypothetical protein